MREATIVFIMFPGCFWENAISCYLTLHHQTPISISPGENSDRADISCFTPISGSGGSSLLHSGKIFEFITKLISVMRPRGHLSMMGWWVTLMMRKGNATECLKCDISQDDLLSFPTWAQTIYLHSFTDHVAVSHTFTDWPGQHGWTFNS